MLPIYTDPAGHLDILSVCSNSSDLYLVTFTVVDMIMFIQLTSLVLEAEFKRLKKP